MAGVKKADIPEIARFMTDIWAFMKSFWIPEDDNAYWEKVAAGADALGKRYQDDFCVAAICFIVDYLEWKHRKKKGETAQRFNTWLYERYRERAREGTG